MKIFANVVKVLTALAAVAGAVYVIATYGEQIVAWAKKTLAAFPCPKCQEEEVAVEEVAVEEAPAEEAPAEEAPAAAEEVPVVEVPAEDAPAAEPVAEESDFEA